MNFLKLGGKQLWCLLEGLVKQTNKPTDRQTGTTSYIDSTGQKAGLVKIYYFSAAQQIINCS